MKLFIVFLLFCSMAVSAQDLPRYTEADCRNEIPASLLRRANITCGVVETYLDPANPAAGTHTLSVVKVNAVKRPAPDPIIFLNGGPGVSLNAYWSEVEAMLDGGLMQQTGRDLILFDQRGVGNSSPSLSCMLEESVAQSVPALSSRVCSLRLSDEGIATATYTTINNAADVEAIRAAMGYPQFNIYGHSYGSRLALAVMRYQPDTARTVLLEGTFPPNARFLALPSYVEKSMMRIFTACAADSGCAAAYGDLEALFAETYAQIKAKPATSGLNNVMFVRAIYYLMQAARADEPSIIPAFINGVKNNDFAVIQAAWEIINTEFPPDGTTSTGMQTLINCADEAPFLTEAFFAEANAGVRPEIIETFADSVRSQFLQQCQYWPRVELAPTHYEGVVSDIPTLITNGTFDQVTTIENAQLAADSLTNATLVAFPGWGHWPLGRGNACAIGIYAAFLAAPDAEVDPSCAADMPIPFVLP